MGAAALADAAQDPLQIILIQRAHSERDEVRDPAKRGGAGRTPPLPAVEPGNGPDQIASLGEVLNPPREVSVVGIGMRTHYGVAEKMFGALAKAKVNIDSITTSEIRISCAVDKNEAEKALQVVCKAFELSKPAEQRKK